MFSSIAYKTKFWSFTRKRFCVVCALNCARILVVARARLCPISFAPCPFPNLAGTLDAGIGISDTGISLPTPIRGIADMTILKKDNYYPYLDVTEHTKHYLHYYVNVCIMLVSCLYYYTLRSIRCTIKVKHLFTA